MEIRDHLKYADNHEWAETLEDGSIRVGITDFAQDALGDIVYVDLPEVGRALLPGEVFGEIESTKSVSDVYAPLAGTVTAINEALNDAPETINASPFVDGWMIVIQPTADASLEGLRDATAYAEYTAE